MINGLSLKRLALLSVIVLCTAVGIIALAEPRGGGSTGGGSGYRDAVNKLHFLDLVKLPSNVRWIPKDFPAYQVLKDQIALHPAFSQSTLFTSYYHFGPMLVDKSILSTVNELEFMVITNGRRLPKIDDLGYITFSRQREGGETVQLAVQDMEKGLVLVDGEYLRELDDKDVAAFLEHEALIQIWHRVKPPNAVLGSTDKIGDIVNITFNKNPFIRTVSPQVLASSLCEAGFKVASFPAEGLRPFSNYFDLKPSNKSQLFSGKNEFVIFAANDCHARKFVKASEWTVKRTSMYLMHIRLTEVTLNGKYDAEVHVEPGSVFWLVGYSPDGSLISQKDGGPNHDQWLHGLEIWN